MINEINQSALNIFDKFGYPTKKNENWKYTNLKKFQNQNFNTSSNFTISNSYGMNLTNSINLTMINGKPIINENNNNLCIQSISDLINLKKDEKLSFDIKKKHYKNPFLVLNTANFKDGFYIRIPKMSQPESFIYLLSISDDKEDLISSYPRLHLDLEDDAYLNIIHHHVGNKKQSYHRNSVSIINSSKGSKLKYYNLYEESNLSYSMNNLIVNQESNSKVEINNFFLDSGFMRSDVESNLNGKEAFFSMNGLFLGKQQQFIDNNIIVNHNVQETDSKVIYKGILNDHSNGVFNSLVNVPQFSKRINSDQKNHNIVLSNTAKINSNPKLKISCDDVKCSHGSTTGNLDKEALFYLQSRGVNIKRAKEILLDSFLDEIINNIINIELKNYIEGKISY